MKAPSKLTAKCDGKPYIESNLSNIQLIDRLASKLFAKHEGSSSRHEAHAPNQAMP